MPANSRWKQTRKPLILRSSPAKWNNSFCFLIIVAALNENLMKVVAAHAFQTNWSDVILWRVLFSFLLSLSFTVHCLCDERCSFSFTFSQSHDIIFNDSRSAVQLSLSSLLYLGMSTSQNKFQFSITIENNFQTTKSKLFSHFFFVVSRRIRPKWNSWACARTLAHAGSYGGLMARTRFLTHYFQFRSYINYNIERASRTQLSIEPTKSVANAVMYCAFNATQIESKRNETNRKREILMDKYSHRISLLDNLLSCLAPYLFSCTLNAMKDTSNCMPVKNDNSDETILARLGAIQDRMAVGA